MLGKSEPLRAGTSVGRTVALVLALGLAFACRARAKSGSDLEGAPPMPSAPNAKSVVGDGGIVAPRAGARRIYSVAAIGDSLTDPKSHGGLYLRYLAEACPESRFDSFGKGGEMVNQMRRRFARDVFGDGSEPKPKYTHVIVFGGVNDLYSDLTAGRTVKKIRDDLSTMYSLARDHGAFVVAITVSPWGGFSRYYTPERGSTTSELNRWILSQKDAHAVDAVVDSTKLLACGDPERLCPRYEPPFHDGLHFGPEGHKRLAAELRAEVFRDCR